MCTVSAIAWANGLRLVCNRDELRSRPIATPPVLRRFGQHEALLPIDSQSRGTWVAVNDAEICFVVLNVNPRQRPTAAECQGRCSRGMIIPALLHCDDAKEAFAIARGLDPASFPPFRLIVLDRLVCGQFASDGRTLTAHLRPIDGAPLMFTSSGLGDELVEHPRRELFDRMVRGGEATPRGQDAFHLHRWADRPHLSVMMTREEASTVSRTIVEMSGDLIRMKYIAAGVEQIRNLGTLQLI